MPGVPGVGQKTAGDLLKQFDTLEGVFQHIDEIAGKKRRENLLAGQQAALLSRQLVRLDDEVPVELDWAAAKIGSFDAPAVEELCREFGFRRLLERLTGAPEEEPPVEWAADYLAVTTRDQLQELVQQLAQQPRISVDTETTSTNPRWAEIVGYSFAWQEGLAYYVPVRAPAGPDGTGPGRNARIAASHFRRPGDRKDRAKYQVRHDRTA